MSELPIELISYIYEFDSTFKDIFTKCVMPNIIFFCHQYGV